MLTWNPNVLPNILDTSWPLLEVSTVLEIGQLHSHDPWAGGGAAGSLNWSMSRHAFLRPDPLNAIANCPLRPTTAGHPDSQRAPQSGFSFLDSDTARWRKWIISRVCLSGDGVPGTSCFLCSHGIHVCAHREPLCSHGTLQCAQCAY